MNARANEPRRTLADIAAKHSQFRLTVRPATHSRGEIQPVGYHDIVRLNVVLIWLDVFLEHQNPCFHSAGDVSRRRAYEGKQLRGVSVVGETLVEIDLE